MSLEQVGGGSMDSMMEYRIEWRAIGAMTPGRLAHCREERMENDIQ